MLVAAAAAGALAAFNDSYALRVGTIPCTLCQDAVKVAIAVAKGDLTESAAIALGHEYCILNNGGLGYSCQGEWQCKDLCGIVAVFAPVIFQVIKADVNPLVECQRFGWCAAAASTPRDEAAWRHTHPLLPYLPPRPRPLAPPSPKPVARAPTGGAAAPPGGKVPGVIRVLHVSDVHVDQTYLAGGWSDCGQPCCCRNVPYSGEDTRKNPSTTAGAWGDYACDVPHSLWEAMLADIRTNHAGTLDFGLLSGDAPAHNVWSQTRAGNTGSTATVSLDIAAAIPGLVVFPAVGNHAAWPVNQFDVDVAADVAPLYQPLADAWTRAGAIDATAAAQVIAHAGSYVMDVPGLGGAWRVLSLNTNFWAGDDFFTWEDDRSPAHADFGGIAAFANATLAAARADGAKVVLMTHRATDSLYPYRAAQFVELIREYADVISFAASGHAHTDLLHVVWGSDGTPLRMQYEAPSVTTFPGINPSYRIYTINATDGTLLDFEQYRFDLIQQNHSHVVPPDPPPSFPLAYSARAAYNLSDLSAASWASALLRMRADDVAFATFYANTLTGTPSAAPTPQEREEALCAALTSDPADPGRLGCTLAVRRATGE